MSLSAEQWSRVKAIVMDAMDMPTRDRGAYVSDACGADSAVRTEVDALLSVDASHRNASRQRLFDPPQATPDSVTLPDAGGSTLIGRRIGRYVIQRLIGMGGMGAVYEARQDGLPRPVALKVMRAGLISQAARNRFQREAQVLARLEHPAIARIYDSGVHESEFGPIPYFAMELISGAEPITQHARLRLLSVRDRVRMFADVCDAVHHGHQRGVIHRDLKPSNILVGRVGDDTGPSAVKVIDFGVARSTDADVTLATLETARDGMAGTLAYMSPEQCALDPADIDIRSDVYALGVVLYELLTGRMPYDVADKPLPEAVRMIQHEPARRPSSIEPSVGGDLSLILLKCLAKERGERYDSAAELAADLRRWLDRLPIAARPASRRYQVRMFARRHRTLVISGAAVCAAIVTGLVLTSVGLYHAVNERDRAKAAERSAVLEKARAQSVTEFLQGVLRSTSAPMLVNRFTDPSISPIAAKAAQAGPLGVAGKPESLREVVERVRAGLGTGSMNDPVLEAELRLLTLQLLLTQGGSTEENERLFRDAPGELRQAAALLGDAHESVLATGQMLAAFSAGSGQFDLALSTLKPLYAASIARYGPGDLRTLEMGRSLLWFMVDDKLQGERESLAHELLIAAERAHGQRSRGALACRLAFASSFVGAGKPVEAAEEAKSVLAMLGETVSDADELVQDALPLSVADLATTPPDRSRLMRIAEVQRRVLDGARARSGGDARRLFDLVGAQLSTLAQLGDFDRGVELMRVVMKASQDQFGPRFHVTTKSKSRVARLLLWSKGDLAEAQRLAEEAWRDGVAASGTPLGDYEVFDHATVLDIRRARGEPTAALEGVEKLIRGYRALSGGHLSWFGGYLHMISAQSLDQLGRVEEARERWRASLRECEDIPKTSVIRIVILRQGLEFFERHGPAEEAERWKVLRDEAALP